MNLAPFTRRLEECRRRWHHRTLNYVLETARILRAARRAAGNERRWGLWIRNESRITRSTAHRYLRVEAFVRSNVSLTRHLVSLSIAKIYDLARLSPSQVEVLLRSGKAQMLNDVDFHRTISRLQPRPTTKQIRPNLSRSMDAAVLRLEQAMKRWQHSEIAMPVQVRMKLHSKLQTMMRILDQIGRMRAAAM